MVAVGTAVCTSFRRVLLLSDVTSHDSCAVAQPVHSTYSSVVLSQDSSVLVSRVQFQVNKVY